jgi:hypothetical protein
MELCCGAHCSWTSWSAQQQFISTSCSPACRGQQHAVVDGKATAAATLGHGMRVLPLCTLHAVPDHKLLPQHVIRIHTIRLHPTPMHVLILTGTSVPLRRRVCHSSGGQ